MISNVLSVLVFPGGLLISVWYFQYHGLSSFPGWGTGIPQAAWHSQKSKAKKHIETYFMDKHLLCPGKCCVYTGE